MVNIFGEISPLKGRTAHWKSRLVKNYADFWLKFLVSASISDIINMPKKFPGKSFGAEGSN